jgi:thiol-disulfide isomerase/thioredoxin
MKLLMTQEEFEELLAPAEPSFVAVYFGAAWCGPCKRINTAVLDAMPGVQWYKVDVDQNPGITGKYGIRAMPTLIAFKGGEPVGQQVGEQIHRKRTGRRASSNQSILRGSRGAMAIPNSLLVSLRRAHGGLAPLVALPLAITVLSGTGYRLLRDWGGLDRDQAHWLMALHEGEWLRPWFGAHGETLYVALNGAGLLWMLASGAGMALDRLRRQWGRGGREGGG